MLKYSLKGKNSLVLLFDEASKENLQPLFELIDSVCDGKKYFIAIDGLEGTIKQFLNSCQSKQYRLYKNGIFQLPTFCLLSSYHSDMLRYIDYIGHFNEGCLSMYFVDGDFNPDLENENNKEKLFEDIQKHCSIKVEALPDGDNLEIVTQKQDVFDKILNWLSEKNAVELTADN